MGTCRTPMHICRHQCMCTCFSCWTCWPHSILPSPRSRQLGHRQEGGEQQGSPPFLSAKNFIHAPGGFYTFTWCLRVAAPLLSNRGCWLNFVSLTLLPWVTERNTCSHQVSHCPSAKSFSLGVCLAQPFAPNYVVILSPVVSTAKETRGIWASVRLWIWQVETWQGCYHRAQQRLYTQLHLWFLQVI